jgi:oxygen-independent coproporphyrinogen-3 oxidase
VLNNLQWAQEAGFSNIQVDLIYGLDPAVRSRAVKDEVLRLVDAGATGISAYALTIEARTLFAAQSALVHEDSARREYDEILETCTSLGLRQFETSNFAFSAPLHNQVYWYGKPYLGLGTGAHGLLPPTPQWPYGRRYKVGQPLKTLAPGNDDFSALKAGFGSAETEPLFEMIFEPPRTRKDFVVETLFTRLRTEEGLPLQWFEDVLNLADPLTILRSNAKISRAFAEGHLVGDTHLRFAPQGKVLGDAWVVDLLGVLEEKGFLHDGTTSHAHDSR